MGGCASTPAVVAGPVEPVAKPEAARPPVTEPLVSNHSIEHVPSLGKPPAAEEGEGTVEERTLSSSWSRLNASEFVAVQQTLLKVIVGPGRHPERGGGEGW